LTPVSQSSNQDWDGRLIVVPASFILSAGHRT